MQQQKFEHEDLALGALTEALRQRGYSASIVSHPDRDAQHPLTVDALIDIDGRRWAVEHTAVSHDASLVSARIAAERALRQPLEKIARRYGCGLFVSFVPQLRAKEADYYGKVVQAAEDAASRGENYDDADDSTAVHIISNAAPGMVALRTTLTPTPFVADQVRVGMSEALERKLTKQLRVAKELGYPVMVLLDQNPRPDERHHHTVGIALPDTIVQALRPVLDRHPGVVDLLWVVQRATRNIVLALGTLPHPHVGPE